MFLRTWVFPILIAPIYWFYSRLWRIREHGPESILVNYVRKRKPVVYAHWHGDELVLIGYYSFKKLNVLSSLSKDGTLMARILSLLGFQVYRGSSSKGGARGLINLIQAVKKGGQASLAVDGPKGPIYKVKPGVVELAARTGISIVPVRTFASRAWFIPKAWNKSYVPKPLAKVDVYFGEAIEGITLSRESKIRKNQIEQICQKIQASLGQLGHPEQVLINCTNQ